MKRGGKNKTREENVAVQNADVRCSDGLEADIAKKIDGEDGVVGVGGGVGDEKNGQATREVIVQNDLLDRWLALLLHPQHQKKRTKEKIWEKEGTLSSWIRRCAKESDLL